MGELRRCGSRFALRSVSCRSPVEEHGFPDSVLLPGESKLGNQKTEFLHANQLVEKARFDGHLVIRARFTRCCRGSHFDIARHSTLFCRREIIVAAAAAGETPALENQSYAGMSRPGLLKLPRSQHPFRVPNGIEAQASRTRGYDERT